LDAFERRFIQQQRETLRWREFIHCGRQQYKEKSW
jgi:hypothetical protein